MCLGWEPGHSQQAPCCYLLSPSFCFSCELSIAATSSGLNLFTWASQILGFYYPACGLCIVQVGCLCPARHRREPTSQSTGALLARCFKGLITSCASEFWLKAPVLCVRCISGSPAAEWTSGLGSSGQVLPWIRAGIPLPTPIGSSPRSIIWCSDAVLRCLNANSSVLAMLLASVEFLWCAASVCLEWTQGCHAHQEMGSTCGQHTSVMGTDVR